jgi:ribosomal-protein-alanine N-acetyltransferase
MSRPSARARDPIGLALETATSRVEVLVCGADGAALAHVVEDVAYGHTRRLTPLVEAALAKAGVGPKSLGWVAADLGPGSFTGVRVGLATARALGLATGAALSGASSLAALAHAAPPRRGLLVPLVPAGRRDSYAGFFRCDGRGEVRLLAAPRVGTTPMLLAATAEAARAAGGAKVGFIGPGVPREREALEAAWPGSTAPAFRHEGLSALDLARAARSAAGPLGGLPAPGAEVAPLYVRSAQAEERVRHAATAADPVRVRPRGPAHIAGGAPHEWRGFPDPWPASFFAGELEQPMVVARALERDGAMIGYLIGWLGAGAGHIGNLAVAPEHRRRGYARRLLEEFLDRARERGAKSLTLEVRATNTAAQALYAAYGFRLAGLRPRYYRDNGEDALVMEWRSAV